MATHFDTVAAMSTPPGKGGVALIRISGAEADAVASRIFLPASKKPYSEIRPRVATYGYIVSAECGTTCYNSDTNASSRGTKKGHNVGSSSAAQGSSCDAQSEMSKPAAADFGDRIDDVLLTRFPAPNSFTGEDVVEICCHGGILVTRCVLEEVLRAGARAAEAGEFTRRAFISGKLSLTEAEAVGTLLEAGSREQIRLSSEPSRRALSERVYAIRKRLVSLMSSIYARIDYPDEDLGDFDDESLLGELKAVTRDLQSLASTYRTGRAITEGISAVIAGKPNVGKSSLYNLLVGEDAAIVTDIAGTTRDVLERPVPLGKVMLRLYDTAGIRDTESADAVEKIGIKKSRESMKKCQLLFAVFDNSRPFDEEDDALLRDISRLGCVKFAIINKSDLNECFDKSRLCGHFCRTIFTTAKDEEKTVEALRSAVEEEFTDGSISVGRDAIVFSARQHSAIISALDSLSEAVADLSIGFSQDAVSGHVERAIGSLGELDGREVNEEVVADIFKRFCVGK